MRIATFNANSIRSRLDIILGWVQENSPDVLCIQETKVQDHEFPIEIFAKAGYQIVFRGQKSYNGVATVSRLPIGDCVVEMGEIDTEARFLQTVIGGVTILNTYVPQGFARDSVRFEYKLQWLAALGDYLERNFTPEMPLVWAGDFNSALDERDVYNPKTLWGSVCYCAEVQEAIQRIMAWGFADLFRMHNEEAGQYTFWDYRARSYQKNNGWRLDYIMATAPLAAKCTNCWIDTAPRALDKASDHTFLVAEFDV
ncbi:MAG: exodeoxyribonuclease III [Phycisphaerae bacterium]|nr:exodeoxyribonuclease III [Phycisphaerae bacterium]